MNDTFIERLQKSYPQPSEVEQHSVREYSEPEEWEDNPRGGMMIAAYVAIGSLITLVLLTSGLIALIR